MALSSSTPFRIVVTQNRVRLVSVRRCDGVLEVRVSQRLLDQGEEALDIIVGFVVNGASGRPAMRALIERLPAPLARSRRETRVTTQGRTHDLQALLEAECQRAFGETITVGVTWGLRRRMRRSQRSIRLGSYTAEQQMIRIHPLLDQPAVPAWFVGFVLYHELLHHQLGLGVEPGARFRHPPAFRNAERLHPHFEDSRAWERTVLPRLMQRGLPW
jgi:hypothetical protein